jgi:hypothetical protein
LCQQVEAHTGDGDELRLLVREIIAEHERVGAALGHYLKAV